MRSLAAGGAKATSVIFRQRATIAIEIMTTLGVGLDFSTFKSFERRGLDL